MNQIKKKFSFLSNTYCIPQLSVLPQTTSQTCTSRSQHTSVHLYTKKKNRKLIFKKNEKSLTDVFHIISFYYIVVHKEMDFLLNRIVLLQYMM